MALGHRVRVINARILCVLGYGPGLKVTRFALATCLTLILTAPPASLALEASDTSSATRVLWDGVAGHDLASGDCHEFAPAHGANCCTPCPSCAGALVSSLSAHNIGYDVWLEDYSHTLNDTLLASVYRPPKIS